MMYRFYLAAVDLAPAGLLLIPIFFVLDRVHFHSARKSILYCLLSCYLATVYVLVGMPNITYIRTELNLNLIPFLGLLGDWKNSILNVILFIPLGIMLPILWRKYRSRENTVIFGFTMSIAIEILQIFTFRATDVNDLITNTLGTFLGFTIGEVLLNKFPSLNRWFGEGDSKELYMLLAIVLGVMFFVYPFVSSTLWNLILS